ncbi:plastocyanin/azurin family copper-binding protein [Dechloromonas sp. HYN0024]|uniref:plastocyanin/azurin family copper-binding protein n=1 Tax=Dechloromonas sp. HYN0024 TaxID=2231055 RepID=UPI0013C2C679|nr:plastocyanin/azurin family copper-binding protein [Dechloromonas sp. HYN0024]
MPMVSPWLTGVPLCLLLLSSSALAGQEVEVRIDGYHYVPASVSISVGDRVRWVNHEKRTSHSVVFPGEAGLESERMFPDESWVRDFDTPGRYNYHCGPHPEMEGVVVVGE